MTAVKGAHKVFYLLKEHFKRVFKSEKKGMSRREKEKRHSFQRADLRHFILNLRKDVSHFMTGMMMLLQCLYRHRLF